VPDKAAVADALKHDHQTVVVIRLPSIKAIVIRPSSSKVMIIDFGAGNETSPRL